MAAKDSYNQECLIPSPTTNRSFRQCLGYFATGVAIVTARIGGSEKGMTINSFASVSMEPPIIVWSVGLKSSNRAFFEAAEAFAINILSAVQANLSRQFSSAAKDRFENVVHFDAPNGSPLLEGCSAYLECTAIDKRLVGDHIMIFGRVERFYVPDTEEAPLIFSRGRLGILNGIEAAAQIVDAGHRADVINEIYEAYQNIVRNFETYQKECGLDLVSARVLTRLEERGPQTRDGLVSSLYFDPRYIDDAVASLRASGLIAIKDDRTLSLTSAGMDLRRKITARWNAYRESLLAELSVDQQSLAAGVLRKLSTYTSGGVSRSLAR